MIRRLTSDRWLAVGGAVATIAAAAALTYWQLKPRGGFWQLPGFLFLGVLLIGLGFLMVGFFKGDAQHEPHQVQHAGDHSTNLQAGGDIRLGRPEE